MDYFIICLTFAAVQCFAKTQHASAANSTDSEVHTFYLSNKCVQWIRLILQNIFFVVDDAPTNIYEDSSTLNKVVVAMQKCENPIQPVY